MTTPDIEKLRGLLAEIGDAADYKDMHTLPENLNPYKSGFGDGLKWVKKTFESAGLSELLADYERLLRERDLAAQFRKEVEYLRDAWPLRYYSAPSEFERGILAGYERAANELTAAIRRAKQPPAVSEPVCKICDQPHSWWGAAIAAMHEDGTEEAVSQPTEQTGEEDRKMAKHEAANWIDQEPTLPFRSTSHPGVNSALRLALLLERIMVRVRASERERAAQIKVTAEMMRNARSLVGPAPTNPHFDWMEWYAKQAAAVNDELAAAIRKVEKAS